MARFTHFDAEALAGRPNNISPIDVSRNQHDHDEVHVCEVAKRNTRAPGTATPTTREPSEASEISDASELVLPADALKPQERRSQTVIIFDWDDTLFCKSALTSYMPLVKLLAPGFDLESLPSRLKMQLRELEAVVQKVLEQALAKGRTYVVTNGQIGWVEKSAAKFLPGLLPILEKVEVISARSKYEGRYPYDMNQWKLQTFHDLRRQWNFPMTTNLISVGDAEWEMDAAYDVMRYAEGITKTVKLQEKPSGYELLRQLHLLSEKFERLIELEKDCHLCLNKPASLACFGWSDRFGKSTVLRHLVRLGLAFFLRNLFRSAMS